VEKLEANEMFAGGSRASSYVSKKTLHLSAETSQLLSTTSF
jgi:hypothetical protein